MDSAGDKAGELSYEFPPADSELDSMMGGLVSFVSEPLEFEFLRGELPFPRLWSNDNIRKKPMRFLDGFPPLAFVRTFGRDNDRRTRPFRRFELPF